jgi:cyclopropane fatty-acyl-phospholipid synthase-like methyltransferase
MLDLQPGGPSVNTIRRLVPRRLKRAVKELLGRENGVRDEPAGLLAATAQQYWSASATENDKQDLSHWKGSGRWADEESWRRIGEDHFDIYRTLLRLADRQEPVRSMIEWGPGGGANAVRFAREIPRFYGVDISEPNLSQCRREVESTGYTGFVPVRIEAADPEDVLDRIGEKVDLFLCTAVYQHFPDKEHGVRITELAHELLADGGVALIQTRYDDGNPYYAPKTRDYWANAVVFTSYRIEEFWQVATDAGFHPLAVVLRPATNYAFYLLSKPRSSTQDETRSR